MKLFAIRHKPSGGYLPAVDERGRARRRGHSNAEPSTQHLPRLFPKRRSAEIAMRCWLKGVWEKRLTDGPWEEGGGEDYTEIVPRPDRRADDMEVVELRLEPVS